MAASTRESVSLGASPEAVDVSSGNGGVPTSTYKRCCALIYPSPWHFASDGGGRFDLASPRGTCYVASDTAGAMREVLGPYPAGTPLSQAHWRKRRVWSLRPTPNGWTKGVADLLSDTWSGKGITNELFTITPYALPQRWAKRFADAGWDGLRVRLRHLMSPSRYGLAVFGPEGAQSSDQRFRVDPSAISDSDIQDFSDATGIPTLWSPVPGSSLYVVRSST